MIDNAAAFFNYFKIDGWFYCPTDSLAGVKIAGVKIIDELTFVGIQHLGIAEAYGPDKGFSVQSLITNGQNLEDLEIVFLTRRGREFKIRVAALCEERESAYEGRVLLNRFLGIINEVPQVKLLDIGGRARSGVDRSKMFDGASCTVLDVLPGDNVNVVGDAHSMSHLFPPCTFDAIFSQSVFEHLLMPWVVAIEMARVLKIGGVAFIGTHQTIGMHDCPWDFWRFSDTAWDGLFNQQTGFEVIGRALENPQFIVPHFYSADRGKNLEGAVGYIGSAALVRKIGEPMVSWGSMKVSDVVQTTYPDTFEPTPRQNI